MVTPAQLELNIYTLSTQRDQVMHNATANATVKQKLTRVPETIKPDIAVSLNLPHAKLYEDKKSW